MKLFKHLLLYFGLFAVLMLIFTRVDVFRAERIQQFSKDQEQRLAGYLRDVFVNSRTLVEDEAINEAVRIMADRLLETIDEPRYDYNIYVIRNRSVNAFALPGGNLVLHTGLFAFAESPEEVAAVLAHEIGHSEEGHIMQKLVKEIGFGVVFAALTGGDVGALNEIGRRLITTRFDREYEMEADAFALRTLEAASIEPRYLAVFFHRLSETTGDVMDRIDFISTHPSNNSRRQAALAYETDEDFESRPLEGINWELVKGLAGR
ncbi:MAG: M48 family metallopeptidase [Bacteroidetes bacterium]|nr:M48 family metallopeptidase [Bacteroidota bacterium]